MDKGKENKQSMERFEKLPIYPSNRKYLNIREIAKDDAKAIIPHYKIISYTNALLTPINIVFVRGRYVPTGVITAYDDKKVSLVRRIYLFFKFRFLNEVQHHAGTFLFAHDIWSINYYHWMCEALPRLLIMHKAHPRSVVVLPLNLKQMPFVCASLDTLRLNYTWISTDASHVFTSLVTVQSSPPLANLHPLLQRTLKEDLLKALKVNLHGKAWRKIYISRAKASRRKIENEHELLPLLAAYGYEIIYAETLSYQEQIALFHETAYCIALHGAGLTNCMFMPPASRVMEIRISAWSKQPLCFWRLVNLFDLKWSYHLAGSIGEESNFNNITISIKSFSEDLKAFHL